MKTLKFTSAIATLSLVLFLSTTSIANTRSFNAGYLFKSDNNSTGSVTSEKDLSYLRFDANDFIPGNESEIIELPVANEFEYLRFDVNRFAENNHDAINELPVNEYDYLRFDANDFISSNNDVIDQLPLTE